MNKKTLLIYGIECEPVSGTINPDGSAQWWIPVTESRTLSQKVLAWYRSILLRLLRLSGYDMDE